MDVTVVVVTWNGWHLLVPCLDALFAQTLSLDRYRVLVVDNGSRDDTVALVRAHYPAAQVLALDQNRGFAGGMAAALPHISTHFVALVNNDARVQPDYLSALLDAAQSSRSDVGAWTARIMLDTPECDRPTVNSTGLLVARDGNGRDRSYLATEWSGANPEVFGFCGGGAMLRMSAVAQAGGFDGSYFLYYEDTDLSWRMRLAGWSVNYVSDAVMWHLHGASSKLGSTSFRYFNERNRLTTLLKNAPLHLVAPVVFRHPAMSVVRFLRGGSDREAAVIRLRAWRDFLGRAPQTLAARRSQSAQMQDRRGLVASLLDRPVSRRPGQSERHARTPAL